MILDYENKKAQFEDMFLEGKRGEALETFNMVDRHLQNAYKSLENLDIEDAGEDIKEAFYKLQSVVDDRGDTNVVKDLKKVVKDAEHSGDTEQLYEDLKKALNKVH